MNNHFFKNLSSCCSRCANPWRDRLRRGLCAEPISQQSLHPRRHDERLYEPARRLELDE